MSLARFAIIAAVVLVACADDEGAGTPSDTTEQLSDATAGDAAVSDAPVDAAGDTVVDVPSAPDLGATDLTGLPEVPDVAPDAVTDVPEMPDVPDAPDVPPDTGPEPIEVPVTTFCEDLNPLHCVLPWPSDRYLTDDPSTPSGHRLAYAAEAFPVGISADLLDTTPYERLDGFSPSSQIITLFPQPADLGAVAGWADIGASLATDHPTVIVDLVTGERVAHWVENDARAEDPAATLIYLRPVRRLEPNRSYGVAIRSLSAADGAAFEASEVFAALRDGVPTTAPSVEARRPGFETLFTTLEAAGVAREDLQIAWRFHTASDQSIRQDLLAIREDALARLGANGIGCTITSVEDNYKGIARRRVSGTVTTPWYMSEDEPPGVLVRGPDGAPVYSKNHEVAFTAIVPKGGVDDDTPVPLITWGHGLFGEAKGTVSNTALLEVADSTPTILVATDWAGMSNSDLLFLGTALVDPSKFFMLGEWLQQGMINQIALTRTMRGVCGDEDAFRTPNGGPAIDSSDVSFIGGSQGSILGGTLLTVGPDFERGVLIVGGSNFSFMIERSTHFNTFEVLLAPAFEGRLDVGILMALSQHVWDRGESAGWLGATTTGIPEAGIAAKQLLYLTAANDAQVPNLSSDLAVRLAGVPVLEQSVRKPYGVPEVAAPYEGSAFISLDVGDPDTPSGNQSPASDEGGHGSVGFTPEARALIGGFLATGVIPVPCGGATCDLTGP